MVKDDVQTKQRSKQQDNKGRGGGEWLVKSLVKNWDSFASPFQVAQVDAVVAVVSKNVAVLAGVVRLENNFDSIRHLTTVI